MTLPLVDGDRRPDTTTVRDLDWCDYFLVSFSGGKDSIALALSLRKKGVPAQRIILMHQHVDGEPSKDVPFMDWPCTESYCRAFAKHLGVRILFQWRHGGFRREMLKDNDRSAPVSFDRQDGTTGTAGGIKGKISARRKFPQVSANLAVRWCSTPLKIDTAALALNNEPAFKNSSILFLTGERSEEMRLGRRYAEMETHRCTTRKPACGRWRIAIDWSEQAGVVHPAGVQRHAAPRLPPGVGAGVLPGVHLRPGRPVGQRAG